MAGERFGVPTAAVVEVFRPREIARLPESEAPLVGVTVWRGELLELLDLRALLGLARSVEDALTHVAVLEAGRSRLGLLVALEREILSVPTDEVHGVGEQSRYVRGVTQAGVQVLDPSALLAL
jgi:purine-binding chemotaxis protein CheW